MKVIKKFDFASSGRQSHDWDTLTDGKIRQCVAGEDYSCKTDSFRQQIYNEAKKRGLSVQVSKQIDDGVESVIFRFYSESE